MSEIDDERLEEWQQMQRLVGLAWGLNHGSGITGKIEEMEEIAERLNHGAMDRLRPSFLNWMNDMLCELNQRRQTP